MKASIIGPSGYIAKRHLSALKKLDYKIESYLDIVESDFIGKTEKTLFFQKEDEYFNYIQDRSIDLVICLSPNFLHFEHILKTAGIGIKTIVEKPLLIKKTEFDHLISNHDIAKNIFGIMQLRLHPKFNEIKNLLQKSKGKVRLEYLAKRPKSYLDSWKVNTRKSGGLLYNIGIHYFDLVIFSSGKPRSTEVEYIDDLNASGNTDFMNFNLDWKFSIDGKGLNPGEEQRRGLYIEDRIVDFTNVSDDLHYLNYLEIVNKSGYNIMDFYDTYKYLTEICPNE